MPRQLSDLPPELLPAILKPLVARRDLYTVCLVCRSWSDVGQRLLLAHVRLFGRDLAIAPLLFQTLADNPHLAEHVRKLEVRVYPLSLILKERLETEWLVIRMLRNCKNCEELVWTRKGALTDRVFQAINSLRRLRSFECNAHTNLSPGSWDADHFVRLPPLRSLSLILPDRNIANILPSFFKRQKELASRADWAGTTLSDVLLLEEFSVLCRESAVINDALVRAIAPALANSRLTSLAFAGCTKLTGAPLLDLLPTLHHLRHLALEACNLHPSFFASAAPSLIQLRSIKLTHPGPRHTMLPAFFPALETLLHSTTNLTAFTLYYSGASSTGQREWPTLPLDFIASLAASVGPNLRKFEVSGVLIAVEAVEVLAQSATELRNLVLHLGQDFDLPRLTASFAPLSCLRTLHLLSQRTSVTADDVLTLAERCHSTLRQIGFRNRVWIVKRTYTTTPSADEAEDESPQQRTKVRFYETAAAFGAFRRNKYGAESDVETEVESESDFELPPEEEEQEDE
ncbi:F-box domain, cyclin-like domain containing protein [Rhodotorula toruloides]|uniref:F-box domain, cyclin-like domain containing protein n=1 Tax=Rhodotorula toruloides TaxID=5286 RepID=A0A511KP89_RHOTO|nr:F-box domain, cyclin-like domain containing protein [Rhodotorula toruloides]